MKENKMTSPPVMAIIVTYNPEIELFRRCLEAVSRQVPQVLITDNGSTNVQEIKEICKEFPSVIIKNNNGNLGLPVNYNAAAKMASEQGFDWLLIMDQDSVLPEDFVSQAIAFFNEQNISIICPNYWDTNLEELDEFKKRIPEEKTTDIQSCISSGSLCRVEHVLQLGGFDEKMFIDYVDLDYCRTCIENGLRIVQLNHCIMAHQIGTAKRVRLLGKDTTVYRHNYLRKYYFFRNRTYSAHKHGKPPYYYKGTVKELILLFYEDHTFKKLLWALKGIYDGRRM